jgi:hypothetical protein
MIRINWINHNYSIIALALLIIAGVVLVVNLISPINLQGRLPFLSENPGVATLTDSYAADAVRWQALADYYLGLHQPGLLTRGQQADTARWQALADYYLRSHQPRLLTRGQQADANRWQALAKDYIMVHSDLSRSQLAEAARWTALAVYYGNSIERVSPEVQILVGK